MGHGNQGRSAAAPDISTGQAVFSDRLAIGNPLGSSPSGRPSASDPTQGHQWLETWQRNEIRWLSNRVEELERRLRWRTIILGSALALSMLTAGAAAGWAVALLYRDDRDATHATLAAPSAGQAAQVASPAGHRMRTTNPETASPLGQRVALLPAEEGAGEASRLLEFQAEHALDALIEEASPGSTGADSASMPTDDGAQSPPSATDDGLTEAGAEGIDMSHQAGALEPAPGTVPGQHEEPTSLEAGRLDSPAPGGPWGRPEYYVSTAPVNLRAAPTAMAAALAVLPKGDLVKLIGREGSWLHVEHSDADAESLTGWAHTDYLRRIPRPEEDGP